MLTTDQVQAIVDITTVDNFDTNMKEIYNNAKVTYSSFVARCQKYQDKLSLNSPTPTDDDAEDYQYEFYLLIREVIETEDPVRYKIYMDILNLFFLKYKDDAYSPKYIKRIKILELNNIKDHVFFGNMVTIFSSLCDKSNTQDPGFKKLLDRDYIRLSDVYRENLINYYKDRNNAKITD